MFLFSFQRESVREFGESVKGKVNESNKMIYCLYYKV